MIRDKHLFASEVKRVIAESPYSHYRVAGRGLLTPQVLSKICSATPRVTRGATEAQVFSIAVGVWCKDDELRLLRALMDARSRGAGLALRGLLALHQTTPNRVALETGIGQRSLARFLDDTLIPTLEEALRIFVAAVVRDDRREKINSLLECAGYYGIWPCPPPAS